MQEILDKQVPPWLRCLFVGALFGFAGYVVDAYIGIAGVATGLLAVVCYRAKVRE